MDRSLSKAVESYEGSKKIKVETISKSENKLFKDVG